jgi:hypothetical protein
MGRRILKEWAANLTAGRKVVLPVHVKAVVCGTINCRFFAIIRFPPDPSLSPDRAEAKMAARAGIEPATK